MCHGSQPWSEPDVDALQQFLKENGLQLVIRSHEGPDARVDRDDMPPMTPGYSTDHVTESELVQLLLQTARIGGMPLPAVWASL